MNFIKRTLKKIDVFQQSHKPVAFMYAVVKKYGDDMASYQAALISYYGFLSLFPLLLVVTTITQIVLSNNEALRAEVSNSISQYIPIIGEQLQTNVQSIGKTGLALVVGLFVTFYGAKGGADALQHALNQVWQVPRPNRVGFPKAPLTSLGLIVIGGLGLLGASILSGYAAGLGQSIFFQLASALVSILVLYGTFHFIFRLGTSRPIPAASLRISALVAAVGVQILQIAGGYLLTSQLKNLSSLYGTFAIVLGLLFWIYLQAQMMLYAVEIGTVHALKLWPRSLTQDPLTDADKEAYRLYAKKESYQPRPKEQVNVSFQSKK